MAGKSFYSNEIKEFWPFQKVAQKVAIFLGYFFEKKIRLQPKKVAQMAKFRPIWSHWALSSATTIQATWLDMRRQAGAERRRQRDQFNENLKTNNFLQC